MSDLSVMFGLSQFAPSFNEVGKVEIIDGKPKEKPKQTTVRRKQNKGKVGCMRLSEQASKKLRASVVRTLAAGGKYTARTMAEKIGFAQSAVRRHLKALVEECIADCETINDPRYDVTWYWITE